MPAHVGSHTYSDSLGPRATHGRESTPQLGIHCNTISCETIITYHATVCQLATKYPFIRLQVCCLLLASDANAEAETIHQETPLAMAARGNHCRVLRLMLSRKVDPERADCDLNTPAHLVAYKGCLTCMTSLLRSGASADTPNNLMVGHAKLVVCIKWAFNL